ncbi:MAG TPA: hypothetical protein VIL35_17680 [Vicinamibacterales bacterium]
MRAIAGALVVLAAAALFFTLPPAPRRAAPSGPASSLDRPAYVARGVYHVHTDRSDGSGTVDEVAAAAAEAGVQFVIFADHGDGTRSPLPPSYRAGVLCIDGVEISTDSGHYVALGLPPAPYRLAGRARDVIEDVHRFGGFGFAAHPDSLKPDLQWRDWEAHLDGIEWLNLDSEWRDETGWRLARALLHYPLRPVPAIASLVGEGGGMVSRWAELARVRRTVGLAAVDAHARFGSEGAFPARVRLEAPGYAPTLATMQIGVELEAPLTGSAADDGARVLQALREGRVFSVVTGWAEWPRVSFTARRGSQQARMGGWLGGEGSVAFVAAVDAPAGFRVRLLCDGRPVGEGDASLVLRGNVPADTASSCQLVAGWMRDGRFFHWLVTNPIYLRARDPEPAAPDPGIDTAASPIGSDPASWHVEHDPASTGEVGPGQAPGSIRMTYRLAAGARESQYIAFVTEDVAGLADARAIRITAAADREMRVSVQLRDPSDGGDGQRWIRSIVLAPERRTVTIPIHAFRSVGEAAPAPSLDRIHAILLVVDTVNTPPGRAGTIELEALAAH